MVSNKHRTTRQPVNECLCWSTSAFIENEFGGCKIHKDDIAGLLTRTLLCRKSEPLSEDREWTTEINVFVACAHVVEFFESICGKWLPDKKF